MATKKKTEAETEAAVVEETIETPKGAAKTAEEETVTVHLFQDSGRYKDDVFVGLNGKFYTIQRGVDVEVPVGVAEIIRHSMEQDKATADEIARITTD